MAKIDWIKLEETILDITRRLEKYGYKEPTVRSVYYVLSDRLHLIPATHQYYKALDAKIVEMRRDGKIPWGYFAVKRGTSRRALGYVDPDAWATYSIDQLRNAHTRYQLPRWYQQSTLVEVWVEKDGLLGATANWVQDLEVTVRAPQGYGAWEFINESVNQIKEELEEQEKENVVILYLGDLDPSGKDIPRFMEEDALAHFGLDVEFVELALTPSQVTQYKLPSALDTPETAKKIGRDPRLKRYVERYGRVFTELDSFYGLTLYEGLDAPIRLVRDAIEARFDKATYDKTRQIENEYKEDIRDIVNERVNFK